MLATLLALLMLPPPARAEPSRSALVFSTALLALYGIHEKEARTLE